jgi:Ca-activated chloride channel family protein
MAMVKLKRSVIEAKDLLLVEVIAPQEAPQLPPPALALVLDRSGSMAGKKLSALQEAARALAEQNLAGGGELHLVAYNDEVLHGYPRNPREAEEFIAALEARGSTDLLSGWQRGAEGVEEAAGMKAVVLLSDGLANRGVTDPRQILAAVRQRAAAGVQTSTVGFGEDYDEALLAEMALAGGGGHHYVDEAQPEELRAALLAELAFLRQAVLQSVQLRLSGAAAGSWLGAWHGRRGFCGAMAPGERRTWLLELEALEERGAVLEAEIEAYGPERHRLSLPAPHPQGSPGYRRVLLEYRVAQVYRLLRRLPEVRDREGAQALAQEAEGLQRELEGFEDPRLPRLKARLEELVGRLKALSRRFDEVQLKRLGKEGRVWSTALSTDKERR